MASVEIRWKKGSRFSIPAKEAFDECRRISKDYKIPMAAISEELVVREASNPESPLHDAFEWADDVAADNWRNEQARRMLRSFERVRVVCGEERSEPAFVNVVVNRQEGESPERMYVPYKTVMTDEDMRAAAFDEAIRGLNAWRKRIEILSPKAAEYIDKSVRQIERAKASTVALGSPA